MAKPDQAKETPKIRKERVQNQKGLYTRIVPSKKAYKRKHKYPHKEEE
jgi:hypothetical protein